MFVARVQSDDPLDARAAGPRGVDVRRVVSKTQCDSFTHTLFDLRNVRTIERAVHSTFTARIADWIANWITRVEFGEFVTQPADARKPIRRSALVDQRARARPGVGRDDQAQIVILHHVVIEPVAVNVVSERYRLASAQRDKIDSSRLGRLPVADRDRE